MAVPIEIETVPAGLLEAVGILDSNLGWDLEYMPVSKAPELFQPFLSLKSHRGSYQ